MICAGVAGLTEFLPISSTVISRWCLCSCWATRCFATAAIQLGSIVAVMAYFRSDLSQVLRGIVAPFVMASGGNRRRAWTRHGCRHPVDLGGRVGNQIFLGAGL